MNIAIVGRLEQPGGVQSVILSLTRGLNSLGIMPDIIWDQPYNAELLETKGVSARFHPLRFHVPSRLLDNFPVTARYFLRALNVVSEQQLGLTYDFYYIFYNGFLVENGAPHIRYLSGPPLLPQLDMVSPGLRGMPYRVLRFAYRRGLSRRFPAYEFHRSSHYVINSEYTARLFEEAHGARLPVVHPPIDLSGRSFRVGDISQRDTVTYFSRFADYKRPMLVLELAGMYPQQRFVLMGGVKPQQRAFFDSLRQAASARGLSNVEFIDNPSEDRVRQELFRSRFYIFPGVNEHFGMATAEAIASGAIPFVHDSGGQPEIVPDARLRFTDACYQDKFALLRELSEDQLGEIQKSLHEHVLKFSEEAFIVKMLSFLPDAVKVRG